MERKNKSLNRNQLLEKLKYKELLMEDYNLYNFQQCFNDYQRMATKATWLTIEIHNGKFKAFKHFIDIRIDIVYNEDSNTFRLWFGVNGHPDPELKATDYILQSTHGIPF
jgi:hypothetical protein